MSGKSEYEKDQQLKEAAAILCIGVGLLSVVIMLAFGLMWGLFFLAGFCLFVAVIKADGAR